MEDQVSFGSFNPGPTDWVRANTEILTSMNIAEVSELLFLTEDTAPFYMPEIILSQAPAGSLDDPIIGFAADAGVTIHAWTVNDEEEMNRLLDAGVNKIITDRPSLLHDVLVERGLR